MLHKSSAGAQDEFRSPEALAPSGLLNSGVLDPSPPLLLCRELRIGTCGSAWSARSRHMSAKDIA